MNYKYATWILAVVAVVLAVMLFMNFDKPVANTFDDISERVTKCRVDLATWTAANPKSASTSAVAAAELEDIMEDCEDAIKESQKDVGGEMKP